MKPRSRKGSRKDGKDPVEEDRPYFVEETEK